MRPLGDGLRHGPVQEDRLAEVERGDLLEIDEELHEEGLVESEPGAQRRDVVRRRRRAQHHRRGIARHDADDHEDDERDQHHHDREAAGAAQEETGHGAPLLPYAESPKFQKNGQGTVV